MKKLKVLTIIGTRPELIKLSRVIAELDLYTEHVLVHTGQNYDYELNKIFFDELSIRSPDYFMNSACDRSAGTIAKIILETDKVVAKFLPDALLVLGDTNSCLSVIAAKRLKVPIFHMEAGNRCFDQRVPEEINRKIVDHVSDINLTYTEHARRYLMQEGIQMDRVIKTGSPMPEVLAYYRDKIDDCNILEELKLIPGEYFLVSLHREENVDDPRTLYEIIKALNNVSAIYKKKIIFSTHPRTKHQLQKIDHHEAGHEITFLKAMGFLSYIKLQKSAFCVISDSGTITEECSILGFPAVTIREAHERPEGMDVGALIMTGLKCENIINSIDIVTSQASCDSKKFKIPTDYQEVNVSKKVLRIIMSYTDFIKRNVWYMHDQLEAKEADENSVAC